MKTTALAASLLVLFLVACPTQAEVLTFQPDPVDLYDLEHSRYYTWGLSPDVDPSTIEISTISLKFDNIRNWDSGDNVLYVHLLDSADDGVTAYYDGSGGGDAFAGQGIELVTYVNLPNTPQDLVHTFTDDQVATFAADLLNGSDVGLGFDPDCHFWNDGVTLEIEYNVIPEPGCAILITLGAVLTVLRKRARR